MQNPAIFYVSRLALDKSLKIHVSTPVSAVLCCHVVVPGNSREHIHCLPPSTVALIYQ